MTEDPWSYQCAISFNLPRSILSHGPDCLGQFSRLIINFYIYFPTIRYKFALHDLFCRDSSALVINTASSETWFNQRNASEMTGQGLQQAHQPLVNGSFQSCLWTSWVSWRCLFYSHSFYVSKCSLNNNSLYLI